MKDAMFLFSVLAIVFVSIVILRLVVPSFFPDWNDALKIFKSK